MEQAAKQCIFKGRVQGVGFRFTVRQLAEQFSLTGFVKNLPDGSVKALLQGSPHMIEGCLTEIKDYYGRNIRDIIIEEQPVNSRYTDFHIAF